MSRFSSFGFTLVQAQRFVGHAALIAAWIIVIGVWLWVWLW